MKRQHAFTLVELSIVLVIIGLLVGGIMAGQSLLRMSQLRGVMSDLTTYASAIQQFRTEFRALPGDLSTATSYWGTAGGTGSDATCYGTNQSTLGTSTCNGDGDATLDLTNAASAATDGTEMHLAWRHLANAGTISTAALTGRTATTGSYDVRAGTNAPRAKIDDLTYMPATAIGCISSNATYYDGCYPLTLIFGKSATTYLLAALITPEEMYSIDKKLDDAAPGFGQVRAFKSDSTCASSSTAYVLTSTGQNCRGIFGVDPITANQ